MPNRTPRRGARRQAANVNTELTFTADHPAEALARIESHAAAVGEVIDRLRAGQRPSRDDVDAVMWALADCRDTRVVSMPPRFRLPNERRRPDEITPAFRLVSETLRVVEKAAVLLGDALKVDPAKLLKGDIGATAWTIARERAGIAESAPKLRGVAAWIVRELAKSPLERRTIESLTVAAGEANIVRNRTPIRKALRELEAAGLVEPPPSSGKGAHDGWALTERGRELALKLLKGATEDHPKIIR